jgi:hypothetical protein
LKAYLAEIGGELGGFGGISYESDIIINSFYAAGTVYCKVLLVDVLGFEVK